MEQVLLDYLKLLDISVSKTYFRKSVASHPEYPSILSVADTLERLGIKHAVARVQKDDLENLPIPFVLHLKRGQGQLLLIRDQQDLDEYRSDLEDWDGVILLVEKSEITLDKEHQEFLSRENTAKTGVVVLGLSAMLFFGIMLFQHFTWYYLLLLATALTGIVLGLLLTAKDVGIRYEVVESFCNAGQNINCDRVLTSDEATLFGRFKLSDAVLSYFIFQLIVVGIWLPVGSEVSAILSVMFVFTMLSIPIVGYSLYLQGVKLKSWCRLCLLVGAVFLVQAAMFGWMYTTSGFSLGDAGFWPVTQTVLLLVAIGSLEFILKSKLEEASEAVEAEIAANRVKYSPEVFMHLLAREKLVDTTPFETELLIGKANATVQIIMAASLGCGPCKNGFEKAVDLVNKFPHKVALSIRFRLMESENGQPSDIDRYILSYWLTKIYGKKDETLNTQQLIRDWYELADLEKFKEKYSLGNKSDKNNVSVLIQQHTQWMKEFNVDRTPTFFVNGYMLPSQYKPEDLNSLFPGLTEHVMEYNMTGIDADGVLME